jgi:hypothetical protein
MGLPLKLNLFVFVAPTFLPIHFSLSTDIWGQKGASNMIFYEFYLRDETSGDKLIGILPERRKTLERTGLESVMNWPRLVFGNTLDIDNIYFVIVTFDDNSGRSQFKRKEILALRQNCVVKE